MQFNRVDTSGNLFQNGSIYVYLHTSITFQSMHLQPNWSYGGQYIFVPPDIKLDDKFPDRVKEYCEVNPSALFTWVSNPNALAGLWEAQRIEYTSREHDIYTTSKIDIPLQSEYLEPGQNHTFIRSTKGLKINYLDEYHFSFQSTDGLNDFLYFQFGDHYRIVSNVQYTKLVLDEQGASFEFDSYSIDHSSPIYQEIGLRYSFLSSSADTSGNTIPVETIQYNVSQQISPLYSSCRVNLLQLLSPSQTYIQLNDRSNYMFRPVSLIIPRENATICR
ncbi:MAG: hypothetical protein ACLSAP_10405 [Oscillospiraceae bacterium]